MNSFPFVSGRGRNYKLAKRANGREKEMHFVEGELVMKQEVNKRRTSIVPAAGLLLVNVFHPSGFFTFFSSMLSI